MKIKIQANAWPKGFTQEDVDEQIRFEIEAAITIEEATTELKAAMEYEGFGARPILDAINKLRKEYNLD